MVLAIILIIAAFTVGFFVGRNNPDLKAVNKLIDAGEAVVDAAGKLIKK